MKLLDNTHSVVKESIELQQSIENISGFQFILWFVPIEIAAINPIHVAKPAMQQKCLCKKIYHESN